MEKLELNGKTYNIIDNIGEIKYDKMIMFNQYALAVFQHFDKPLFQITMDKIKSHYNKGDYMQAYNELVNYDTAVKFKELKLDPLGMCFALMLEGDETDENVLQEKLKEMTDNGLKWDTVKKKVWSFMKLYPDKLGHYLQAWEIVMENMTKQ